MGLKNKFKKQGVSKKEWLDWLSDDKPSAAAQAELRARRVEQAKHYQYVPRTPQPPIQSGRQVQPPQAPTANPTDKAPAVSIQIQIPAFDRTVWRRRWQRSLRWFKRLYRRAVQLVRTHRRQSIGGAIAVIVVLIGLFLPHLVHIGKQGATASKSGSGASGAASGGASAGYDKPPFDVVVPSSKPKLATPDGAHSAYDGKKNTYSFSDSLKGNGFIVSQQPVPPQFKDGTEAVSKVTSQLSSPLTSTEHINTLFGSASIITNSKYNSQTVVVTVRSLLLFIQSAHSFTGSDWTDYINALQ